MELDVRQNIIGLFSAVADLTGGFHYDSAPKEPTLPYCRWNVIVANSKRDTVDEYAEYYLQFQVFDKVVDPTGIETITNDIYDAFDGASPTFTNWFLISIRGVRRPLLKAEDNNYWSCITEAKLFLQKK